MKKLFPLFLCALFLGPTPSFAQDEPAPPAEKPKTKKKLTDAQIKKILIRESIAAYPGNCPCPYNTDSAGRRCGGRSAWSRDGGYAPLCYPKDVTKQMVEEYRRRHEG